MSLNPWRDYQLGVPQIGVEVTAASYDYETYHLGSREFYMGWPYIPGRYIHPRIILTPKEDMPVWVLEYIQAGLADCLVSSPYTGTTLENATARVRWLAEDLVRRGLVYYSGGRWVSYIGGSGIRTGVSSEALNKANEDLRLAREGLQLVKAQRDAAQDRVAFLENQLKGGSK